jgi:membrane-bound serine protease (ClpP class)
LTSRYLSLMLKGMRLTLSIIILAISVVTFAPAQETGEAETGSVYVIPLREDVDRYLGVFLGRSLETAESAGAELIIIEIDTFGGRVDTALEIASKIGAASSARTVAYVPADSGGRGVSWSAGALMAFSCSELWMAPGTSMGAAAPVYQTSEGMQAAEEKTVSAVRGQMSALAEKNGYPVEVALAMVDADVVLKEIIVDGEVSLATAEEIDLMERQGETFEVGITVSDAGKLLTLTAGQMERYGVSSGTVATRDDLILSLGFSPADTVVLEKSRADSVLTILTSGVVTSLLLVVGLVALYMEATSPGFGVMGTISLIAFAVVFGASGLMGNLGPLEILMFLVGIALLLLEIFIIPGFGIAGISGIVLILSSLVFSLQDFYWPQFDWQWTIARRNVGVVGGGVIGGLILIAVIMASMPRISLFNRLILKQPGDPDYAGENSRRQAGKDRKERKNRRESGPAVDSSTKDTPVEPSYVGMEGTAVTDLRPVGKIRIGVNTVVAETDGEYYDKGTQVVVLRSDGVKVVVAAKEDS